MNSFGILKLIQLTKLFTKLISSSSQSFDIFGIREGSKFGLQNLSSFWITEKGLYTKFGPAHCYKPCERLFEPRWPPALTIFRRRPRVPTVPRFSVPTCTAPSHSPISSALAPQRSLETLPLFISPLTILGFLVRTWSRHHPLLCALRRFWHRVPSPMGCHSAPQEPPKQLTLPHRAAPWAVPKVNQAPSSSKSEATTPVPAASGHGIAMAPCRTASPDRWTPHWPLWRHPRPHFCPIGIDSPLADRRCRHEGSLVSASPPHCPKWVPHLTGHPATITGQRLRLSPSPVSPVDCQPSWVLGRPISVHGE
jgi:hypothetical protein